MKKKLCAAFLGLMIMATLSGCEENKGEPITISIKDGMTTTILDTYKGETVAQMLEEAELSPNEKDEVTPGFQDVIEADGSEITIARYAKAQVIYDEGDPIEVELCGANVQDAIDASNVTVGPHDYVDTDTERLLEDGMVISITKRAQVRLVADGKKSKDITAAKTVQEYLDEKGITLGKLDRISKDLDTPIEEKLKIVIKRVVEKEETEKESISYYTEYEDSSSMYSGQTSVKRNGSNGEKEITYKVTYVDGKEESREQIKEVVIKQPVSQIIVRGIKQKPTKTVVSKQYYDDCDGSGHGMLVITYSDGTQKTQKY